MNMVPVPTDPSLPTLAYGTVALGYTRKCPLACRHCITDSSPQVKGKMGVERARRYLSVLPEFTDTVCFTGGEALIYHRDIVELIRDVSRLGLRSTLTTSAAWAQGTEETVRTRAHELLDAGLHRLMISWDLYHEEFLSREVAVRLARICVEIGLNTYVRMVLPEERGEAEYRAAFEGLPLEIERTPLMQIGRARTLPADHFVQKPELPLGRCNVVTAPLVDWDGTVYACCGPSNGSPAGSPLILGNAEREPLEKILRRGKKDPILETIYLLGPYGLFLLLEETGKSALLPRRPGYTGMCDLCRDFTDSPDLVRAVREALETPKGRRLLVAGRLTLIARAHHGMEIGDMPPSSCEMTEPVPIR